MSSSKKEDKKFIDYSYLVNEMVDDMTSSITNVKQIIEGQVALVDVLKNAETSKLYEQFTKQIESTTSQYEEQVRVLEHRLSCIKEVKAMLDSSTDSTLPYFASMLLESFGAVNKEAKTVEEREQNKEDVSLA